MKIREIIERLEKIKELCCPPCGADLEFLIYCIEKEISWLIQDLKKEEEEDETV